MENEINIFDSLEPKENIVSNVNTKTKKNEDKTFEMAIKELETLVGALEKGNLSLDESILTFEKGINVAKECTKKLDDAEIKINVLIKSQETDCQYTEQEFVAKED